MVFSFQWENLFKNFLQLQIQMLPKTNKYQNCKFAKCMHRHTLKKIKTTTLPNSFFSFS